MTKYRGGAVEQPVEQDPAKCSAYGCPLRASVNQGGGWQCFCHAWATPDKWQAITRELREHDWLIGLIGDLQRLYNEGSKDQPWLTMAREFWAEYPDLKPTAREVANWNLYLWRMRAELEHRVGARSKKPEPLEPAQPHPKRGNATHAAQEITA
ncbi:MAG: hypothetical protein HY855_25090 [Burkholderiales bacterium]|nr:hypothetical protein [Burkholderiales bacterium]